MAPLVVGDLVIAGVSGGDEGIRGFLAAYRADTGEQAWRFWTVPARGEPAADTWKGERRSREGRRRDMADRHLRSGDRHAVLADRKSLPGYRRQRAAGRQPLHEFHPRARREDRQAALALPVHAARSVGLGCAGAAGAHRRGLPGAAAQDAAAGEPQRLLLRARSHRRKSAARPSRSCRSSRGPAALAPTGGPQLLARQHAR